MMRAICLALGLALSGAAYAGDAANLTVLGFNRDGSIFAFEEYGIQDGSGFPYANRFYVYTRTDSFVEGSPFRMRSKEDGADIAQARNNARAKGEAIIEDKDLNTGLTAGYRSLAQVDGDPRRMVVRPRAIFPPVDRPITFELAELPFDPPANCSGLAEKAAGFTLTMTVEGTEPRELNRDKRLPESRACPLGYSIQAVQTYYPDEGDPVFAVIIAVRSLGFEGPDHRFIAVAGKL